jgi:hypothetical protein
MGMCEWEEDYGWMCVEFIKGNDGSPRVMTDMGLCDKEKALRYVGELPKHRRAFRWQDGLR